MPKIGLKWFQDERVGHLTKIAIVVAQSVVSLASGKETEPETEPTEDPGKTGNLVMPLPNSIIVAILLF